MIAIAERFLNFIANSITSEITYNTTMIMQKKCNRCCAFAWLFIYLASGFIWNDKRVQFYLQPTHFTISLYLPFFLCFLFSFSHTSYLFVCLLFFFCSSYPQPNQTHKKQHTKYVNWAKKGIFFISLSLECRWGFKFLIDFLWPIRLHYQYVFYYSVDLHCRQYCKNIVSDTF